MFLKKQLSLRRCIVSSWSFLKDSFSNETCRKAIIFTKGNVVSHNAAPQLSEKQLPRRIPPHFTLGNGWMAAAAAVVAAAAGLVGGAGAALSCMLWGISLS